MVSTCLKRFAIIRREGGLGNRWSVFRGHSSGWWPGRKSWIIPLGKILSSLVYDIEKVFSQLFQDIVTTKWFIYVSLKVFASVSVAFLLSFWAGLGNQGICACIMQVFPISWLNAELTIAFALHTGLLFGWARLIPPSFDLWTMSQHWKESLCDFADRCSLSSISDSAAILTHRLRFIPRWFSVLEWSHRISLVRCSCSCSLWDLPTSSCTTNAQIWVTWLLFEDRSPQFYDDVSFFSCVLPSSSSLFSSAPLLSSSSLSDVSPRSLFVLFVRLTPLAPLISYCTRWWPYLSRFGFLIATILAICRVCCLTVGNLHIDSPFPFTFPTVSTPKIPNAKTPQAYIVALLVPPCWRLFCGAIEY